MVKEGQPLDNHVKKQLNRIWPRFVSKDADIRLHVLINVFAKGPTEMRERMEKGEHADDHSVPLKAQKEQIQEDMRDAMNAYISTQENGEKEQVSADFTPLIEQEPNLDEKKKLRIERTEQKKTITDKYKGEKERSEQKFNRDVEVHEIYLLYVSDISNVYTGVLHLAAHVSNASTQH